MTQNKKQQILVESQGLKSVQARPALSDYIKALQHKKDFIKRFASSGALATGRGTNLGKLWIILNPILQIAIYALVFGAILKTSRGMSNFVGFLAIGVIFFGMVSKGTSAAATLVRNSKPLITSFNFPKASIVFASVYRQLLDNIIPATTVTIAAIIFQKGNPLTLAIAAVPALFIMLHVFILGLTFIIARAVAFIPDFRQLVAIATRGLFFLSGVFFSVDHFDTHPILKELIEVNPIYLYLMSIRTCVIDGELPKVGDLAYLSLFSIGLTIIGFVYFWLAEERYVSSK